jgi:hypothetical protein
MSRRLVVTISMVCMIFFTFHIAHATDFIKFDLWSKDNSYTRGSLVRSNYDLYISVIPSHNKEPEINPLHWRKILYNQYNPFELKKIYLLGSVIKFNDEYFISKKINIINSTEDLNNIEKWINFTHPGINYDLPIVGNENQNQYDIQGDDTNHNGIRDDFELKIIFSDLDKNVIDIALESGRKYGDLIQRSTSPGKTQKAEAIKIINDLVAVKKCKRELDKKYHKTWKESDFFNTLDRVEAKFKIQNAIFEIAGEDTKLETPLENICDTLFFK